MAAPTSSDARTNDNTNHPAASPGTTNPCSFIGNPMNGSDGAPVLATGALPMMGLGAEATTTAAVHRLPFQQLAHELAQYLEVLPRLTVDLVHGGVDQGHQPAYRWSLAQLRSKKFHRLPVAVALSIQVRQCQNRRDTVVAVKQTAQ